ncbi:hypothetical protein Taro_007726, partial [Colocasia esculenta]|nr:hypothetical protein [Colocasia esculenta]
LELTNYAITQGFNWKYLKNDYVHLIVRCNQDACPRRLHASVIRQGPQFAIKTMNNIHIKGKLLDKPIYRASEMKRDLRRDYDISIPYH